jgi:hypothetical protein
LAVQAQVRNWCPQSHQMQCWIEVASVELRASRVPASNFVTCDFFSVRDQEVFQSVSGPDCCDKPARLLAPARPRLRWRGWVAVFWKNFWIFAPGPIVVRPRRRALNLAGQVGVVQAREALLQFELFRGDFLREDLCQLLVQEPEFVEVHPVQINFFLAHRGRSSRGELLVEAARSGTSTKRHPIKELKHDTINNSKLIAWRVFYFKVPKFNIKDPILF